MKTLLLFLILITIPFSYSCSQNEKNNRTDNEINNGTQCEWSTLEYSCREGTVPPPYFYCYTIFINSDDTSGFLKYTFGYSQEDNPPLEYKLNFSDEGMNKLNEAIDESRVLTTDIAELPNSLQPDGGSTQCVKIVIVDPNPNLDQPPKVIDVPYFPEEEFTEGLNKLYGVINKLVPDNIWNEISSKQTEYILENENK